MHNTYGDYHLDKTAAIGENAVPAPLSLPDRRFFTFVSLAELVKTAKIEKITRAIHVLMSAMVAGVMSAEKISVQNLLEVMKIEENLDELALACDEHDFAVTAVQIKNVKRIITELKSVSGSLPFMTLGFIQSLNQLAVTLSDEISTKLFFCVPFQSKQLYESDSPFSPAFGAAFRESCSFDAQEAAKCLAFQRATACVFHLMRVAEQGVRALGKSVPSLSIDFSRNQSWDRILKPYREQLLKQKDQRAAEWQIDDDFYSTATQNLLALKDASRDPTMHAEKTYTVEEAEHIFAITKGFMHHLSTRLKE